MPINNLEIKPHFMAVELRKKWTFSQTSHFRNSFDVTLSHVCSTFIHLLLHLKDYFISDLKLSRRQSSLSKKKKKRQERRIDAYMLNIFSWRSKLKNSSFSSVVRFTYPFNKDLLLCSDVPGTGLGAGNNLVNKT